MTKLFVAAATIALFVFPTAYAVAGPAVKGATEKNDLPSIAPIERIPMKVIDDEKYTLELARGLEYILIMPDFQKNKNITSSFLKSLSELVDKTSVKYTIKRGDYNYIILYNWMADTIFRLKIDKKSNVSFGAVSVSYVYKNYYKKDQNNNILVGLMADGPILAKNLLRDMRLYEETDALFSRFIHESDEMYMLKNNLASFAKLLKQGATDPCATYGASVMRRGGLEVGREKNKIQEDYYPAIGSYTRDGRAVMFSNKKDNANFGMILFEKDDKQQCKPTKILTSSFVL